MVEETAARESELPPPSAGSPEPVSHSSPCPDQCALFLKSTESQIRDIISHRLHTKPWLRHYPQSVSPCLRPPQRLSAKPTRQLVFMQRPIETTSGSRHSRVLRLLHLSLSRYRYCMLEMGSAVLPDAPGRDPLADLPACCSPCRSGACPSAPQRATSPRPRSTPRRPRIPWHWVAGGERTVRLEGTGRCRARVVAKRTRALEVRRAGGRR